MIDVRPLRGLQMKLGLRSRDLRPWPHDVAPSGADSSWIMLARKRRGATHKALACAAGCNRRLCKLYDTRNNPLPAEVTRARLRRGGTRCRRARHVKGGAR